MMKKRISCTIAGAIFGAMAVSGAQTEAPTWISFEMIPSLAVPIVPVSVNGSERFPLLIDPSVPDVLLDGFLIDGSGMQVARREEVQEIEYLGQKEKLPVVYLDTLEIGNVGIKGIRALLVEGDNITRADGYPTYGRIGRAFLNPFRLTIHYPRELLLLEPSPEGPDVPAGGIFFEEGLNTINVEVVINDSVSAYFVVDATAPINFLDSKWAREQGLAEKKAAGVELGKLRVGGFTTENVTFQLGDMNKMPYPGLPVGVLGTPVLRYLSVTYDFPRGLLWLRSVEGG